MFKHTQTIRRQKPTICLNVFDDFAGLVIKGLSNVLQENLVVLPGYPVSYYFIASKRCKGNLT